MNDKKNALNNVELSFKDKINMFNAPKKRKTTINDKNLVTFDKNSILNKFQNTNQLINKNNLSNESKLDSRKGKIKESEKSNKMNGISGSSKEHKKFEKKDNSEFNSNRTKKNSVYINPFVNDNTVKLKTSNKKDDKLIIEKLNKTYYLDKNRMELGDNNSFMNNSKILNKKIKDIKNFGNNNSNKEYKENKECINNKEIKIKINKNINSLPRKRFSIQINPETFIIRKEKISKNLSPKDIIKESNICNVTLEYAIKSKSPRFKDNKVIKNKKINSLKESEKNDSNHVSNKNFKKKVNNISKQTKKSNRSVEKRSKKSTFSKTLYIKQKREIILEETQINSNIKNNNTFCKAFLAVSIPHQNFHIIENSEGQVPNCGHEECSELPSIEPEIIYKFPEKDAKDLEISNVAASLCFPLNIKLCLCNEESKISTEKNYKTCLTNQLGDRFYTIINHFYIKITKNDFYEKYKNNDLEKIKDLINSKEVEYIYIPSCICLISKNSYFEEMNFCSEAIFLYLRETNINILRLKEILSYLMNSIPSPHINTTISFPMPNCRNLIELYPCFYRDMPIYHTSPILLLDIIKIENIILLMRLLILEQKVLLISNDYNKLTMVSLTLISLMYPFSWINIYVPIISLKLIKLLESFLPFFFGMHKSLYAMENVQKIIHKSQKHLYIFDIDENILEVSVNIQSKSKNKITLIKYLNDHVPCFPKDIEDLIMTQLGILIEYNKDFNINENSSNNNKKKDKNMVISNIKIKEIFIQGFIELFHNYKNYLTFIGDSPIFNMKSFIQEKPENDQRFFKEFISTQIFQIFIQTSANYFNEPNKKYYFDELIEEYLMKKNNYKEKSINRFYIILNDEFLNKMENLLFKVNKNYYIKPSSENFKFFEDINAKIKNKKGNYINQLKSSLQADFKYQKYLKIDGTIKPNKKIINNDLNIFNKNNKPNGDDTIKNYFYFFTEEEKAENEAKTIKKLNSKNFENVYISNNNYDGMNETQIESLKDDIDTIIRKIFKSEKIDIKNDSEKLLSLVETDIGKDYFLSLLFKNSNIRQNKYINEESYIILLEVISKTLIKLSAENQKDIIYIMKLLKSIRFFNTIIEKDELSLIQDIIEYLSKNNCGLFKEVLFWELWVEQDLMEDNQKIYEKFEKFHEESTISDYDIDEDDKEIIDFKNNCKCYVEELVKLMMQLKISKHDILSTVGTLCDKFIQIDEFKSRIVTKIMGYN